VPTLAEVLGEKGYTTASVAANYNFLGPEFGLDRGFEYLDVRAPLWTPFGNPPQYMLRGRLASAIDRVGRLTSEHLLKRTAGEITASATALLSRLSNGQRPFFLFVNYMDAHSLCLPPEPYASMFAGRDDSLPIERFNDLLVGFQIGRPARVDPDERRHFIAQYDGAVAYEDNAFGNLVDALRSRGVLENTLLIFTSDHGEVFGEREIIGHGTSNYDDQLRVPLVVKGPGQRQARIETDPVSTIAIHQMILDAAGIGAAPRSPGPIVAEAFPLEAESPQTLTRGGRAIVQGGYKLIENVLRGPELYDVAADPRETRNLALEPALQPVVSRMRDALARWQQTRRIPDTPEPSRQIGPAEERRLRSLGYVH